MPSNLSTTPLPTPVPTPAPALVLRGLRKEFASAAGPVRAVDGLDLEVAPGEVVAFLGPNGAGKTSTIDMVLGLSAPTSGTVRVLGADPADAIAAGRVAAVMQTGGLLRDITVAETVALTAALFGRTGSPAPYLERAGIADLADRLVGTCSGGQQQRLRFAMALVSEPDLLLLDEPTTGMDVAGRRAFWSAVRADAAAGRTVLFATHHLEEADAYADRVVLLSQGRVVADGPTADVKSLASGRTVSARIDDDAGRADALARLRGLDVVDAVDLRGARVVVRTTDADAVAALLLTLPGTRDLEVAAHHLEDAFVALTTTTATATATDGTAR